MREIEAPKAKLLSTPTRGHAGYAHKTVNSVLICLRKTLGYAMEVGSCRRFPRCGG